MNYAWQFVSGAGSLMNLVNSAKTSKPNAAPAQGDEVSINLEGLTSAIRIAMFPYAPDAKIKVDEFAVNFDLPQKFLGLVDINPIKRRYFNLGRKDLVIVKRVARIMIDLFPPVPIAKEEDAAIEKGSKSQKQKGAQKGDPQDEGKKNTKVPHITQIYLHLIKGLEFLKDEYFHKATKITKIPDVSTFDFDEKLDANPSDESAAVALQETINLLKYCCEHKIEPKQDLKPLQKKVRDCYTKLLLKQFANGLALLEERQGNISPKDKWIGVHEFYSLDNLVEGSIARYQQFVKEETTLVPPKSSAENG